MKWLAGDAWDNESENVRESAAESLSNERVKRDEKIEGERNEPSSKERRRMRRNERREECSEWEQICEEGEGEEFKRSDERLGRVDAGGCRDESWCRLSVVSVLRTSSSNIH